jgi:hypothetical protein
MIYYMLLIINLGIILTLLIIILFNIHNTRHQIILTLGVLSVLIVFKLVCDKMIKNNKKNDEVDNKYEVNNDNASIVNTNCCKSNGCKSNGCKSNGCKCNGCKSNGCKENGKQNENKFDLNNLEHIVNDMKNISNSYNEKGDEKGDENIDRVNVNNNNYIFTEHSGNKDYHFKDLHNGIFWERKNVSGENSLLLDNLDCMNDNSCIIQPTIYNFHKV